MQPLLSRRRIHGESLGIMLLELPTTDTHHLNTGVTHHTMDHLRISIRNKTASYAKLVGQLHVRELGLETRDIGLKSYRVEYSGHGQNTSMKNVSTTLCAPHS